jgi:hypothetical protein
MSWVRLISCSAATIALLATIGAAQSQQPQEGEAPPPVPTQPMPRGNLEHGRYIVENIAMCVECHSERDHDGKIIESRRFHGGQIPFRPPWPNNWAERAPRNAGLLEYTDVLAMRLLTQGAIDRRGVQLRPPMPRFRMTPQDAADVIVFMRSLK